MTVAVVGGGISGLAAAWTLASSGHDVVVLEAASSIGGKLRVAPIAGVPVDVGAEAMLARRPEGLELVEALGLRTIDPLTTAALVRAGGALHPLPARTMLGIPGDVEAVRESGALTEHALSRIAAEPRQPPLPPVTADLSVGSLVRSRLGNEVADRLVEPLLGGVYAGRADRLSVQATTPALYTALQAGGSLVEAAAQVVSRPASTGPVFASLPGGLGSLPVALAASERFEVRTGVTVRSIRRDGAGFVLSCGAVPVAYDLRADAVVVATPAAKASRLLAEVAPVAAAELDAVESASMAIVTFAFRDVALPPGSGLLVGLGEGLAVKGVTISSQKWPLDTGGLTLLRASVGRIGDAQVLHRSDHDLIALVRHELTTLVGITAAPEDAIVTRWGGGLPQYGVGHVARIARVRAAVADAPGLAVCAVSSMASAYPHASPQPGSLRRVWENEHMVDGKRARELNDSIRHTAWSVFKVARPLGEGDRSALVSEVDELFDQLAAKDVVVRGTYDVSALRADADLMVWWHASTADALQEAYSRFRRTVLGTHLEPVWSNMALHRPAEFNKSHVPAFLAEEEPRAYVCVYPFVRSYEWYLLPDAERRALLAEHGQMAREYPEVRANTVASFALGDYEWMLAFEADELHRIVDLMRHLRGSETRRHVREEVPFYTGSRRGTPDLVAALP